MGPTTEEVARLMKRCQVGVGGRSALDMAHDIMAECYGTLGALVQERDRLLQQTETLRHYLAANGIQHAPTDSLDAMIDAAMDVTKSDDEEMTSENARKVRGTTSGE